MNTKDDKFKKIIPQSKSFLKRSVSTTGLKSYFASNLNLREAKSYTGPMDAINSYESLEKETEQRNEGITFKDESTTDKRPHVETKDLTTNEVVLIPETVLHYQGKVFNYNDISYKWKKDCRMWLWKNKLEYKSNKSVAYMGIKPRKY